MMREWNYLPIFPQFCARRVWGYPYSKASFSLLIHSCGYLAGRGSQEAIPSRSICQWHLVYLLIMERSNLFGASCSKPLILDHFRATKKCLIKLFVNKWEKALIYKGFRASPY